MDPIEARALWSQEVVVVVVVGEAGADGCMVELSEGVREMRGLWYVVGESRSYDKWYIGR